MIKLQELLKSLHYDVVDLFESALRLPSEWNPDQLHPLGKNASMINMIKLKSLISEVRVINPKRIYDEPPLMDNETIRLYHGFYDIMDAIIFAMHGMSGKEIIANRVYSYETVNNPKGLFVTINLETAKLFSCPGVILEFDSRVSDLEAPVWHGGRGYFGQGAMTTGFSDRSGKEREVQRMANREKAKNSSSPLIFKSDRPELAEWIFGPENQALFIGDLNPNMIRQYWVSEDAIKHRQSGPYVRMSRKEFLKVYGIPYIEKIKQDQVAREKEIGSFSYNSELAKVNSSKLFKPADNYDKNSAITNLQAEHGYIENIERLFDEWVKDAQEGNYSAIHQMRDWFWPKQLKQMGINI